MPGANMSGVSGWLVCLGIALSQIALGQQPTVTYAVDGASFQSNAIAPGSIATVFGTGLASTTETATVLPLPTTLAGTTISLCSAGSCQNVPLFYVSPKQANFLVPASLSADEDKFLGYNFMFVHVNLTITTASGNTAPFWFDLVRIQPEVFLAGFDCWFNPSYNDPSPCVLTWNPISNNEPLRGAITDQQGRLVSSTNPARIGRFYTVWLTGMGGDAIGPSGFWLVFSVPVYGSTGNTTAAGGASFDTAGGVTFAGPSSQFVGLYQVNFQLPPWILGTTEVGPGQGSAYPPLWPCGEYKWDLITRLNAVGEWFTPNSTPVNLPILIEPGDAPCAK